MVLSYCGEINVEKYELLLFVKKTWWACLICITIAGFAEENRPFIFSQVDTWIKISKHFNFRESFINTGESSYSNIWSSKSDCMDWHGTKSDMAVCLSFINLQWQDPWIICINIYINLELFCRKLTVEFSSK